MTQTNNLKIDLVAQSQAQKEVTINEAIAVLEALQNRGAKDKDLATPPVSPVEGDVYIIASSPTGAWSGKANYITYYNQNWKFINPNEGLSIWVSDEDKIYAYNGSAWISYADNLNNISLLGINATADSTNKLSVASSAVLLNHNGTDIQLKLNKNATANKSSILMQNAFSGRAEIGLLGTDDFTFKVSADGTTYNTGMLIEKSSGKVYFSNGISFDSGTNLLSSYAVGTWTPVLRGSTTAGTNTYTVQYGRYTRVGRIVYISGRIAISGAVDATMAGTMQIAGLPFTVANQNGADGIVSVGEMSNANLTASTQINGIAVTNGTVITLGERNNVSVSNLTSVAKFGSNFAIRFNLTYEI